MCVCVCVHVRCLMQYFLYREYLESEKVNRIVLNRNARALIRYNIMKAEGQLRAKEATQRRAQGDESGSEGAEEEGDMTQSEGDSEGSDGEEKPGGCADMACIHTHVSCTCGVAVPSRVRPPGLGWG